ncbi:hypothetical protein IWW40_005814 [Coemansia sp. RSA 1250]|nr:hypothetical protein IWW40_005814 [Coemansia sp. RSA 1250]
MFKEYHDNARDTFQVFRFPVTQKSVEILKMCHGNLTNCSFEQSQSHEFPCTSYVSTSDLICALFWRAITRAHLKLFPDDPHTCMMLACDIRKRIGVSQAYCGNASFPLIMHMSKTAMMRQSITSTAMHIRHHIGLLSAGFVHQVMEFMATPQSMQYLMSMFHPTKSFFSASIINKFPMFDMLNFGFGKPVHVDIPAYLNPGFSIWMPTRSQSQPLYVNLSLNHKVFDIMQADSEFRHFVDI